MFSWYCSNCGAENDKDSNVCKGCNAHRAYFIYDFVQIPSGLTAQKSSASTALAEYLQKIVDEKVISGWEFYRIDQMNVEVPPGCLAGIFGAKSMYQTYSVIAFRKKTVKQ